MKIIYIIATIIIVCYICMIFLSSNLQTNPFYYQCRSFCFYMFQYLKTVLSGQNTESDTIICFGDSITNGQGLPKEQSYPYILSELLDRKVIPIGQNGATTLDALKKVHKVIQMNPSIVIIQFGGNDTSRGFSKQIVMQNFSRLISIIHQADPDISIILVTNHLKNQWEQNRFVVNNVYFTSLSVVLTKPHLYIDMKTRHPDKKGHEVIAEIISKVVHKNILM